MSELLSSETRALIYGLCIGVGIFIAGFLMAYLTRSCPAPMG